MFGWEFPPHNSGGLGTACFGLTRALARDGATITFVLPKKVKAGADWLRMCFADLPEVIGRGIAANLYPYITSESYARERKGLPFVYGLNLIEEVRRYGALAGEIAALESFDIIHAHDWLSFPAGIAAKRVSGKPLVVHVHATEFDRTGGNGVNEEVYGIEHAGMSAADAVVAVSQWTKNMIVRHYGIAPQKVTVIHNGIEASDYRPLPNRLVALKQAGEKIVLFVGRITLQKGPDYFVRAAKRVLELEPKVYFIIAGSGDMEGQTLREAAALGIADRVIFTGFLRGPELDALYQSADLYVLPSVSEPFGITPLESLVNGTPVIISYQSGVAEVLRHALKVDFWDTEELANQIITVLRHPPLHRTLKQYGHEEVQKVTWTAAAQKCLGLYHSLLASV
ncbi:MAG TPA: glycosyltransferase family 4 protein [Candidatus Paceibacterota bacterium]